MIRQPSTLLNTVRLPVAVQVVVVNSRSISFTPRKIRLKFRQKTGLHGPMRQDFGVEVCRLDSNP